MDYFIQFNFTTVHGNRFMGRSGELSITTECTLQELHNDIEEIKLLCAQYVHSLKPKYKIFMVDIKAINEVVSHPRSAISQKQVTPRIKG